MAELIVPELVELSLTADSGQAAVRALGTRMAEAGRVADLEAFLADVAAREARMPTGLEGGIGIPHCRSSQVSEPTLAFGRSRDGIDFGAPDGPADLVFLIAAPVGGDRDHLAILAELARRLMRPEFTRALREATDPAAVAALIRGERPGERDAGPGEGDGDAGNGTRPPEIPERAEPPRPPADSETAASEAKPGPESASAPGAGDPSAPGAGEPSASEAASDASRPFRIVAVTSCPTGIAHTYMAAESLERAGREAGVELVVETQGSGGFTRLDPALIAGADAVILAHDVEVRERERFAGKPTVDVGVKAAVNRAPQLVEEARAAAAREGSGARAPEPAARPALAPGAGEGFGSRLRRYLMSGVSYMVPFVAAGGLLIALSFAIGGHEIADAPSVADHFSWLEGDSWAALFHQIGGAAFGFLVPVLAGYIAFGMVDRPGLVPGFVGGAIAVTIEAGFLGGLVAGLLSGLVVMGVQRVGVPPSLRGVMPVLVIPLVGSAVVGFLMFVVVGEPLAALQRELTDWLDGLSGSNAVLLGAVLGAMMCFDLGGPLNKVAYAFAVGGLAEAGDGNLRVMAAVMAAGMVPPLAMALATVVRARLFTRTERENGKAAWVLGASFITEGAIPFAAADPLRVIPSAMAGGALTGALSMGFEATLRAPHGGVFVVPLIGSPFLYLVAIAAGTALSTALVVLLKSRRSPTGSPVAETEAARPEAVPETA
ncbi:PTS system D-fructose-specific IIA component (F1P-forming), Frc family /PTS system D-fructose-specific IIB component (F1P-forming), Frc family /PTS system D-fructose-specific IIC component (F1P-forming), Frc family [Streptomyces zhaozhouensis]|uniref:PTS system D-fructose-specific IIA component (F1P-forming), Frc family /PTS system D-fructose-specific IIB component (F1P-forming), Frc family /PTS system D-fructose-specific IIC component (F1P-for... n=1 Tax=Streptomyces zhaozhouensis TaxID=1300267 RepID=A0A286DQ17_9ACTN|nr:fructose-specific PTS transporter subunit EIIC [Streptomyces zhaozhouensis]SOD60721.1 PTS system D-fructose-specific IIA component (F1P-forming), Frc family /PTS system D-fructose-specific IIB component (F1P-forming), Frc family /PTS system D-fructose-specific IIC component (F1P-forming), Frc family [Streptomyces zhaozhouensis]